MFLSTYCFPVLIFCFYLYLNSCLAREFAHCHIGNVIRLALSDVSFFTGGRVCGVELTFVLWYLSVAAERRLTYSLRRRRPKAFTRDVLV